MKEALKRLASKWRKHPETKHERFARYLPERVEGVTGKRFFEIGSDDDAQLLRAILAQGASFAAGVNPILKQERTSRSLQLVKGDARRTQFPSESFDVAVSLSAFEHVFGLDEVLAEAYRVLKPGGFLISEHGPVWSAAWGHHLWLYHGGKIINWTTHPLPPHAHLYMNESELRDWATNRYGDRELGAKIADYVLNSTEQNRLFYSDYLNIIDDSPFTPGYVGGFDHTPDELDASVLKRLESLYPEKHGFNYFGMLMVLRKA